MKQSGQPIEILLVDSNPTDRAVFTETMKRAKSAHNICAVNDGIEAISFLRRENNFQNAPRPDLIVLDLNLPGKDGREVLAEIKGDPSLKFIPVIVLTRSRMNEDVAGAYGLNANCYLTKPDDFTKFIGMVQAIGMFWLEMVTLPPENVAAKMDSPPAIAPGTRDSKSLPKTPEPETRRQASPRGGETILFVEDEFDVRELVGRLLRHAGYKVFEAAQGSEAFQLWNEHHDSIDLLLTDLVMPDGISGNDVAKKLQSERPGLQVIFTSGYSPDFFGENASELQPGQKFLQKPYTPDGLLAVIRQTLDGQ